LKHLIIEIKIKYIMIFLVMVNEKNNKKSIYNEKKKKNQRKLLSLVSLYHFFIVNKFMLIFI